MNRSSAREIVGKVADPINSWHDSFSCAHIKPLIICRGPVRKESIDAFAALGIRKCGMLLSDKDSLIQDRVRAAELRGTPAWLMVHPVSDYSGATAEERAERIQEIIHICRTHDYDSVFAGYGFMAEDISLVSALESAGLRFIGPNSRVVYAAGFKDEAKRIARQENISVTPGVDQLAALTLLHAYSDKAALRKLASKHQLKHDNQLWNENQTLLDVAEALLAAGREHGVELISIDDLCAQARVQVKQLFSHEPKSPLRLKAVGGGGGKGQRILNAPVSFQGDSAKQLNAALEPVEAAVRDVLSEAKATGTRDNRNILIERNIQNTRHQEIQMIGNGDWVLTMGGRDCSLQMHEQKLLELSVTDESLAATIQQADAAGDKHLAKRLNIEREILKRMEAEATRFAQAVGLNSLSTFECIVDADAHYFMEVNTRIQVEHRVSELCYSLRFHNPDNQDDYFDVSTLLETMVLLATHGKRLPKPERIPAQGASVEARLNATNDALLPHAGGVIKYWSAPSKNEMRDDQGICQLNPDTGAFMPYRLAGAYDSNIALLLSVGENRSDSLINMAEVLRTMVLRGDDLETNLEFHRGMLHWLLGEHAEARPSTAFVKCYLSQVSQLRAHALNVDLNLLWRNLCARLQENMPEELARVLVKKTTLLKRPVAALLDKPHLLSGWLSHYRSCYSIKGSKHGLSGNSWHLLSEMYRYLGWTERDDKTGESIWHADMLLLEEGNAFYKMLAKKLGVTREDDLMQTLQQSSAPTKISSKLWREICEAHWGFQCGNEILAIPAILAKDADFYALNIDKDLNEHIPDSLRDPKQQAQAQSLLAPPPTHHPDEIIAPSGGMFYRRELPDLPPLISEGQTFKAGDPLCVIEVMKMFNKVRAPFAGTLEKSLVEKDGAIIKKGEVLFKVRPKDKPMHVDKDAVSKTRNRYTNNMLDKISIHSMLSS